jgi:hypothetical protein
MPTDNSLVQFQLDYIELLNGIKTNCPLLKKFGEDFFIINSAIVFESILRNRI